MKPQNLVPAFSPLISFTVLGHLLGAPLVGWAAMVSAALALVILVAGLRDGVKLVTAVSMIVFGALAVVALLGGVTGASLVSQFGRAWGANERGQFGDGTRHRSGLSPRRVRIPGGRPVVAVDAAGVVAEEPAGGGGVAAAVFARFVELGLRPALDQFLGSDQGLSPATITRLTAQWQDEAVAFGSRSLAGSDYVYLWAVGIHAECVLPRMA